jgi:carbon-monoxide dehydrogenase medium subunit
MIPAKFDYQRAESVDEALAALAENGDEAKLLAGGHSLLPLMKFRLATPALVVDIGRLRELSGVRDAGDHLAIGALTRHRDLETDPLVAANAAVLSKIAGQVGDPQVRHRGTIGGSIAHGDPASDLPAAVLALGGTFVVRGPGGERTVPASEFHRGFLETALAPDEMLVEIRVPKMPGARFSFQKFNRRAQDWAIVGVVAVRSPNGSSPEVAVSLVNMASTPLRAPSVETAVRGGEPADQAAGHADEGTQPPSDLGASSDFRRHLARVLVRRSLEEVGV